MITSIKQAKARLALYGCTLTARNGEYKVRLKGSPAGSGYFTTDLNDAVESGATMAKREEMRRVERNATSSSYNRSVTLSEALPMVECWNNGEVHELPAGTRLVVNHIYDSEHTTCTAKNELFPGCYRWIIRNTDLNRVAGCNLPAITRDLVGEIIRAESGPTVEPLPTGMTRIMRAKMAELKQDGTVAMSADNFFSLLCRDIARLPAAPKGANAAWLARNVFNIASQTPEFASFIYQQKSS